MCADGEMSPAVDQMIVWGRGSRLASLADPGHLLLFDIKSKTLSWRWPFLWPEVSQENYEISILQPYA
jgi:hypothetical protein